ncbi:SH3 domain-containing protein [Profundibacter sp.]|uniref:SH3 domain-containing protein n=1 Tax=Profundibacter sp. TaxID=3101071 RepID=UPI003D13A4C4
MSNLSKVVSGVIAATVGLAISASAVLAVEATAKSAVNVRSGPGVSYGKVDALYGGETVEITECRGNWCHIQHPGPDGWVSGRYLIAVEGRSEASGGTGHSSSDDAAAAAIIGAIIGGVIAGRSSDPAPAEPELPYGPDTCKSGYVWRDAIPGDHVCVRPDRRSKAARENSIAGSRVNPTGPYGPNTCKVGYVWREAYSGDVVCVTGSRREQVRRENRDGPSHRVVTP